MMLSTMGCNIAVRIGKESLRCNGIISGRRVIGLPISIDMNAFGIRMRSNNVGNDGIRNPLRRCINDNGRRIFSKREGENS